jgi:hypothetical protein
MESLCDGMNIETKKRLFTSIEKIEVDIIMLYENQVEVSQYLYDTLRGKICGMVMESVSLTLMEIWLKTF